MTPIETRLRDNFPAIQMTLVSLIVALVVETLIGKMIDHKGGWLSSAEGFMFLSQCMFLATVSLMYWFTLSLQSASILVVFSPRHAMSPIVPGAIFFALVSTIDGAGLILWLYVCSTLSVAAWLVFGEHERLYEADPDATGKAGTHRVSRLLMLCSGIIIIGSAALLQYQVVSLVAVSALLWGAVVLALIAHQFWYAEWKRAVGVLR
jgi:hypothetical protein